MKHLKTYEENSGFVELTYGYGTDSVMVNLMDGAVIDIYTYKKSYFTDPIHPDIKMKWYEGDNSVFIHLKTEYWSEMLDELLNSENSTLLDTLDDDGDSIENEKYYDDLEEKIREQIPQFAEASKYNI